MKQNLYLAILLLALSQIQLLKGTSIGSIKHFECANLTMDDDTIPPVTYCPTGATTISLPASGCILIWAKDLDRGSIDDVTPVNKLKFYLNGNPNQANIQICCSDFVAAGACDEYPFNIDLWVEDEAGNAAICKTTLIIQDDLDVCGCQSSGYSLKGLISTRCNTRAEGNLKLTGPNNYFRESFGPFIRFYELLSGSYHLCFERNDNFLNGVTTADIVKIQRHILGIEYFGSNAQLLSADVNNSTTVSASDITEVRKLILGLKSKFSNVPSWIFAPTDSLTNPNRVPHVNEFISGCYDFNIDKNSIDNIGITSIKMGDVTCNARVNGPEKNTSRNDRSVSLIHQPTPMNDQLVSSGFSLPDLKNFQGMQFTLTFDPTLFEFEGIQSDNLEIEESQISLFDLDKGKIHIAWDRNQLDRKNSISGILFHMLWRKKTQSNTTPVLSFDPTGVLPLIIGQDLNELDLNIKNSNMNIQPFIELINNDARNAFYLHYSIDNDINAHYFLSDINGRVVYQNEMPLHAGTRMDKMEFGKNNLQGFYLLNLQLGSFQKNFKVIMSK